MTNNEGVVLVWPAPVPAPGPAPDITVLFHSHRSPVTAGEAVKLDSANQCQLELTIEPIYVVITSAESSAISPSTSSRLSWINMVKLVMIRT